MKDYKFAACADLHYALFQNLALLREDMLTDRSDEIDKVFKDIIDSTLKSGIKDLFILGDALHRRNIRSDSINGLIYSRFQYAKDLGLDLHLIIGNHDQSHIAGEVTAFSMMRDVVDVIDKPKIKTIAGIDFLCLPYEEYRGSAKSLEILLRQSKNPNRILLGHLGIADCIMSGSDHLTKEPLTIKELSMDKFISGYLGHYHLPQEIAKDLFYVGSPSQYKLGDKDVDRGYMEVNISLVKGKYKADSKLIKIDSPKFIEVKAEDYNPKDYKGKHYIKVVGADRKLVAKLQDDTNIMGTTGEYINRVVDENKTIKADLGFQEMVSKYVKITEPNRRKHRKLISNGMRFLNEV